MTLRWDLDLVPTIYNNEFIESATPLAFVLPTPTTSRKAPTRILTQPDEFNRFKYQGQINNFSDITKDLCPSEYEFKLNS